MKMNMNVNTITNINDFTAIMKAAANLIFTMEIEEVTTKKAAGLAYGLSFREEGAKAAPIVYFNDLYDRYVKGEGLGSLMKEYFERVEEVLKSPLPEIPDLEFEKIKNQLTLRLFDKELSKTYLEDKVTRDVGCGLCLVASINLESGHAELVVTKEILGALGVSEDELFKEALKNDARVNPATLQVFIKGKNLLNEGSIPPSELSPMYFLTNGSATFGAATFFQEGIAERINEVLGRGYFILPSSRHELIIVPYLEIFEPDDLRMMVREANQTIAEPSDVLSYEVFYYDQKTGFSVA